ncbi:MAG: cardiolipin synthase [Sedimentibacter sp.]
MQKIISLFYNRVFLVGVAFLFQISTLGIIIWRFSNYFVIFDVIFTFLSVAVVLHIVKGRSNPVYKIAWIIPILTFPIFGGLFYILLGGIGLSKKTKIKMQAITFETQQVLSETKAEILNLNNDSVLAGNQSKYIERYSYCPVYSNTSSEYLTPGEKLYEHLLFELKKAERYIFFEFFIVQEGKMWNGILDILKEKAKMGVDVRVIYDDVGCLFKLPYGYDKELESMGIKCCVFNPIRPVLSIRLNNRDHRKIIVIDGCIAYTGGMNIADEYINEIERFGHWKDSGIALKGEAVWSFTVMFLTMWNYLRKTDMNFDLFKPSFNCKGKFIGDGYVQPFNDSPVDAEPVSEAVYMNLINQAESYVYVETPYLIADNNMMSALRMAAKRGVDIKIVTPYIPDKWYVHAVTRSNYEELCEAGVSVYEYLPGFIHAKTFVVDDKYAVVGTINLDYRSLYLHFECGVWMYKTKSILKIKEDVLHTISKCKHITLEECQSVKWYIKLGRTVLNVFSPLM